jgi:predicted  nucleic acid-binding Zn-ribbon protein
MSAITEKTVAELEIDMAELRQQRQRSSSEKMALQTQIAEINNELKETQPRERFIKLNRQRQDIIRQLGLKEQELSGMKQRHTELQAVRDFRKTQENQLTVEDIRLLVGIRDRMHEYSMDAGNPKSAREVAFKFSQELKAVLEKHFQ